MSFIKDKVSAPSRGKVNVHVLDAIRFYWLEPVSVPSRGKVNVH